MDANLSMYCKCVFSNRAYLSFAETCYLTSNLATAVVAKNTILMSISLIFLGQLAIVKTMMTYNKFGTSLGFFGLTIQRMSIVESS